MSTRTRQAPGPQREVTVREAVYLTKLSEREIQKAIEREEVHARVRSTPEGERRVLSLRDVCYLLVRREAGRFLTGDARKALYTALGRQKVLPMTGETPEAAKSINVGPISISIGASIDELRRSWEALGAMREHVVSDPEIRGGEPVVRDTRIPAYRLADLGAQGVSREVLLEDHPSLTPEGLEAALLYAQIYPRRGRPAARRPWQEAAPGARRRRQASAASDAPEARVARVRKAPGRTRLA